MSVPNIHVRIDGTLSGTPTAPGAYSCSVTATEASPPASGTDVYSINVPQGIAPPTTSLTVPGCTDYSLGVQQGGFKR